MFGADSDSANLLLGNKVGTLSRVAASSEPPDERRTFSLPGYLYPLTRGGLIGVHIWSPAPVSVVADYHKIWGPVKGGRVVPRLEGKHETTIIFGKMRYDRRAGRQGPLLANDGEIA